MILTRKEQIEFAKDLLPLVDAASDEATLNLLNNVASLVLNWSGFEDNGVAFAISEYTYELAEIARCKKDTGWKDAAKKSLVEQLNDAAI